MELLMVPLVVLYNHIFYNRDQCSVIGLHVFLLLRIVIDSCHNHVWNVHKYRNIVSSIHQSIVIDQFVFPLFHILVDRCHSPLMDIYRHIGCNIY